MAAPPRSPPTLRLSHTALGLSSRQVVLVLQVSAATGKTKCSAELFSQRWPGGGEKSESALSGAQSPEPQAAHSRAAISAFSRN